MQIAHQSVPKADCILRLHFGSNLRKGLLKQQKSLKTRLQWQSRKVLAFLTISGIFF